MLRVLFLWPLHLAILFTGIWVSLLSRFASFFLPSSVMHMMYHATVPPRLPEQSRQPAPPTSSTTATPTENKSKADIDVLHSADFLRDLLSTLARIPEPVGWWVPFKQPEHAMMAAAQDLRKAILAWEISQRGVFPSSAADGIPQSAEAAPQSAAAAPPPPPPPPPPAPAPPPVLKDEQTSTPRATRRSARRRSVAAPADLASALEDGNVVTKGGSSGVAPDLLSRQILQRMTEGGTPLKRTQVQRSPGGTPARPKHRSPRAPATHQEVIASALRKKFHKALDRSPGSNCSTPGRPDDFENACASPSFDF